MTDKQKAFEEWLDSYWPLWKQHRNGVRYRDLQAAFAVGWSKRGE